MLAPNALPPQTPNTDPANRTMASRAIGLAATAGAGYAMHKGFEHDVLPNPAESLGSPFAGVAETVVIGATLAVTGLREYVGALRQKNYGRRLNKATKDAQEQKNEVTWLEDSYERIIRGIPPTDKEGEEIGPATRNLDRGEVVPKRHGKRIDRLVKARDEIRALEGIRDQTADLYAGDMWEYEKDANGNKIATGIGKDGEHLRTLSAYKKRYITFGSPEYHEKVRKGPARTKSQIKGERESLKRFRGYEQKIEKLKHEAREDTMWKEEKAVQKNTKRHKKLTRQYLNSEKKLEAIRNREDVASRAWDGTVGRLKRSS